MVVLPKGSFKIVYTETLIGVKEVQNPEQFGRRSIYEVNQFLNVKRAEEPGHCSEKLEQLCLSFEDFNQPLSDVFGVKLGGSPMTCQSSESAESLENERRSDNESGVVDSDETRIASAMKDLRNTGWYWGSLTANEAREILHDAAEGTFLVRDSSQRDYLFTISAMTSAGPTNLRIVFKEGKFKLDSVVLIKPKLKQFDSVVHLVEHYMHLSRTGNKGSSQPLTPTNGTVQLLLTRPVYMATPSLQHLCRVAINRATRQVQRLPLPNRLKDYLTDYSYNV